MGIFQSWKVCACDVTRTYVSDDSFACVTWLGRAFNMTLNGNMGVCKVYKCNMTRAYLKNDRLNAWHDSYIRKKWFFSWKMIFWMCDMTLTYVRNDSFAWKKWCFTWLLLVGELILFMRNDLFNVWHDSLTYMRIASFSRGVIFYNTRWLSLPWEMIAFMRNDLKNVWRDTYIREKWFLCMCDND